LRFDSGKGQEGGGEKGGDESLATASLEWERSASASLVAPVSGAALRWETSAAMKMLNSGHRVLGGCGRHHELRGE
jgi:hypothetical protein